MRCGYKGEGSLGIDWRNMVVIIFGVAGAGKTTIGQLLAEELGWRFYEGDDFHSRANIEKRREGIPLTDEDRWPWLESLRKLNKRCLAAGDNAVLACSALKEAYRRRLRVNLRATITITPHGIARQKIVNHSVRSAIIRQLCETPSIGV
jgi:carbohydrate kinase (thermoresistant glucokinase family)